MAEGKDPKEDGKAPAPATNQISAPTISLPKGGGAIRGMGEKFAANPVTGTGSMSVPIATSPGRSGFGPQLSLSYDSGAGNGPFGLGWNLSLPSITRKTDKGLPRYNDAEESDVFILSGAEDLVPVLKADGTRYIDTTTVPGYTIRRYRPRIEGLFARIERWTNVGGISHWRSISKDNITTLYGRAAESQIVDPADPTRIFSWSICESYDDKGNAIRYQYKVENVGIDLSATNERNRSRSAQRYLKRIKYGNKTPHQRSDDLSQHSDNDWMFEVVFDYGEHYSESGLTADDQSQPVAVHLGDGQRKWTIRQDPFSSYRSGFEVRTYRLCRRVLMFHHFDELKDPAHPGGENYLVRATHFVYNETTVASFITEVTQSGYKRIAGNYRKQSLPPVEFTYSHAVIQEEVHEVDAASLENLPQGLDNSRYQWADLDGEGLSGILTEQGGAWFYKRNQSAVPVKDPAGKETTVARFAPLECVATMPSSANLSGGQQLLDLAGDGQLDVVDFDGPTPGFFERTPDEEWNTHRPFTSLPNISWRDPNLKFIDLTGDGHADILITEDQAFSWYPSLAEAGFGPAENVRQAIDEEQGPRLVFADGTQSIYLADMSGDGLTDLVRIRNGAVCYWPNLGYGRFGAKVTMDYAPVTGHASDMSSGLHFDHPDQFDHKRIRLADIDGSGTTDIIYLHRDGVRLYFNQAGNSWSKPQQLNVFPRVDDVVSIVPTDLLGNGTACLVWSSPLPGDARRQMRYVDLMGGQKPHLLIKTINNLGAETEVTYAPSTKFYLQDKRDGKPWITKLPFPVHCVEKVTVTDKWRNTKFSSTYSYHHGYFDGIEREFRGFGRVEQVDTESYGEFLQGNIASPYITDNYELYQPPIKTVTWYHTGAAFERDRILSALKEGYFKVSGFTEHPLPEPTLTPDNLSAEEWREAVRACKGMVLRQEVFELDVDALDQGSEKRVRLFTTAYHNSNITCMQPQGMNRHAVFLVTESEAITYNYELDLRQTAPSPDPRIAHTLNLRFDDYGRATQTVAVVYPRRVPYNPPVNTSTHEQRELIRAVQKERHLAYTETHFTEELNPDLQQHRLPVPCEVITYELTGDDSAHGFVPSANGYFTLNDLRAFKLSDTLSDQGTKPVASLDYHQQPVNQNAHKRSVEWVRMLYFKDNLSGPETFGKYAWLGLAYETYKLALTKDLLDPILGAKLSTNVLSKLNTPTVSGYIPGTRLSATFTDQWWMCSGRAGFESDAARHFYLPERYTDPFGNKTTLKYDERDLFIQSSTDALGNTTSIAMEPDTSNPPTERPRFDYRVLAPIEMVDANGNHTEVAFDIRGMVVASAVKSKGSEADDLIGFDDALANPSAQDVQTFCTSSVMNETTASTWLGNATARFVYHFGEERDVQGNFIKWVGRPAGACGIARETHKDPASKLQVSLECSDGGGNVLMKKVQAEPDSTLPAAQQKLRWIINGLTVLNNKGKPVKQYEPDFSEIGFGCEMPPAKGVTPIIYYDAAGRVVRTEMPDGAFSRVEFSPWDVKAFDANDTVKNSRWYAERLTAAERAVPLPGQGDPQRAEALAAEALAQTASAEDKRAARLAAAHANTPAQVHLDSLGREVIAIAHNRSNGVDEKYLTFTKLDAEGKPLWIRDARGNLVMQYITPAKANNDESNTMPANAVPCYDIAGNLLFQHSMDASDRWMLMDAAGKPMFAWDSRDNVFMSSYDPLHRPTKLELKNLDHTGGIVVGLTQYGEGTTGDQTNNRRGKAYRSFDQSGVVTNQEFDFKGNALRVSRRLANDYDVDTDWKTVLQLPLNQEPGSLLMPETFTQITEYDALNRMTRQYNWHRAGKPVAVYEPGYNERGLLVSEDLTVGASMTATGQGKTTRAIKSIAHDAKGQRSSIIYGNDVTTDYTYDPNTFRLLTLVSTRPNKPTRPNETGLQDLSYYYDPSGNITEIFDAAVPTEYFKNAVIEPRKSYVYDALYRLIEATGREHAGQLNHDALDNWNDCPYRVDYGANNSKAWRNYTQRYTYDSVGNILVMQHIALGSSGNSWTRQYQYATDSNRLLSTGMGAAPPNRYATSPTLDYRYPYDVHGSMTSLPHLPTMDWDYTDHLRHISRAPASQGTDPDGCFDSSLEAWYRYDAGKQRTRKRVKKQGGLVEERFYLGGLEWYRRTLNGALVEEIETLHLFDGKHRLLMVDQVIETDRPALGKRNLYRYTLSNHLGSSTVEVDENADIISYEEYHPYGTTAYQSGRNAVEVKLKRYRYTGMERDDESGLSYHGARYYAPWLGRWGSADPIGVRAGLNLYAAFDRNPIRYSDKSGLAADDLNAVLGDIGRYADQLPRGKHKIAEHVLPHKLIEYVTRIDPKDTSAAASFLRKFTTGLITEKDYGEAITIVWKKTAATLKTYGEGDIDHLRDVRNRLKSGATVDALLEIHKAATNAMKAFDDSGGGGVMRADYRKAMALQTAGYASKSTFLLASAKFLTEGSEKLAKLGHSKTVTHLVGAGKHAAKPVAAIAVAFGAVGTAQAAVKGTEALQQGDYNTAVTSLGSASLDVVEATPTPLGAVVSAGRVGLDLGGAANEGLGIGERAQKGGDDAKSILLRLGASEETAEMVGAVNSSVAGLSDLGNLLITPGAMTNRITEEFMKWLNH